MKKRLTSILMIIAVSSLTAILSIGILNNFFRKPSITQVPPKSLNHVKETVGVVSKKVDSNKVPSKTVQPTPKVNLATLKNDDKALHAVIEIQNFLNDGKIKSLKELQTAYEKLNKYYQVKGLNPETNKELKAAMTKLNNLIVPLSKKHFENSKKDSIQTKADTLTY